MSYIHKGIFGAVAIALTFGAAQFAAGEDLTVGMRSAGIPDATIDRTGKTDRAAVHTESVAPTQTISIHVDRVPETSVLVRVPVGTESQARKEQDRPVPDSAPQGNAPQGNAAPRLLKDQQKPTLACEPVVSVLTEIAKRLQPGRCVT